MISMFRETRAQVSLEYLLTVMFAIILAAAAAVLALNLSGLSQQAKAKILEYRENMIAQLMS